mmetsp:Transcript_15659/g.46475  ORF Transcript_15659/g.46475 Transcript_15659/m.46475 type:complete len:211 (-) Transcript_15659:310-942(-)
MGIVLRRRVASVDIVAARYHLKVNEGHRVVAGLGRVEAKAPTGGHFASLTLLARAVVRACLERAQVSFINDNGLAGHPFALFVALFPRADVRGARTLPHVRDVLGAAVIVCARGLNDPPFEMLAVEQPLILAFTASINRAVFDPLDLPERGRLDPAFGIVEVQEDGACGCAHSAHAVVGHHLLRFGVQAGPSLHVSRARGRTGRLSCGGA